jgi:antitoxin VapB
LSIKSDEADRLARELAAETGETLTEAVEIALRERLDRVHAKRAASIAGRCHVVLAVREGALVRSAASRPRTPEPMRVTL